MTTPNDELIYDSKGQLHCQGDWTLSQLPHLERLVSKHLTPSEKTVMINGKGINALDSAGAWLLDKWRQSLEKKGYKVNFSHFSEAHQVLLKLVESKLQQEKPNATNQHVSKLALTGQYAFSQLHELQEYIKFIGKLSFELLRILKPPIKMRWEAYANILYKDGYQALAIIALLSFMIGVVITYQMGLQLRNYGANIYIVDLLGLAILREFGPLLTAIMIAGRTGSAFTAQLGIMKINQEVDALNTLGVTPAELLLLPRIIGLLIALPLLTMWADIFGVLGGMVMSNNMLNITWYDFLHRFPHVIKLKNLLIGLGKAPVFALIIASIGCFKGMQVSQSADSVGTNTTRSVVLSIFFIIVADAIFSIIFSKLKL